MMKVKAYRTVTSRGPYGESGTGYGWGELSSYGDFSAATRGHLQGHDEPCEIELLVPGAEIREAQGGQPALFLPGEERGWWADEALEMGYARVVGNE